MKGIHTMSIYAHFHRTSGPWPPGSLSPLPLVITLLVSSAALIPCSQLAQAERREPVEDQQVSSPVTERRRWWLETWSHSMQETCFINWMNTQFRSATWQMVMTSEQVNIVYVWWLMVSSESLAGK